MPDDFDAFLRQRIAASDAFVGGDYGPLGAISTGRPPATICSPEGTWSKGRRR